MRAPHLALLFLPLLVPTALADPLKVTEKNGSPALEGEGASATTVSVIGGTVSATVEGSGSIAIHTHSGSVSAEGTAGVPQLGIELRLSIDTDNSGAATGSSGAPAAGAGRGSVNGGINTNELGASTGDTDGSSASGDAADHHSEDAVPPGTSASAVDPAEVCLAPPLSRHVTMLSLTLVRDASRIRLVEVCAASRPIPVRFLGAIERNDVLMDALAAGGYSLNDVVGADTSTSGAATLFVAAQ